MRAKASLLSFFWFSNCSPFKQNQNEKSSHLLSHHGEHFELDPVELIEARPGARGGQSFEELRNEEEIKETLGRR